MSPELKISLLSPQFCYCSFSETKNPCYILLHMNFWSIPVLCYSKHSLTWPPSLRSSGQNFELAPQLRYLHHGCRTFRSSWFCTLIIRDCKYCDGLLYVIFWSILLRPNIYGQIYSTGTPTSVTPNCQWWNQISKFNKSGIRDIFTHTHTHTQLYTMWFGNCGY